jgi:hypothetical protein
VRQPAVVVLMSWVLRLAGLVIAVHELLTATPEPAALTAALAMMGVGISLTYWPAGDPRVIPPPRKPPRRTPAQGGRLFVPDVGWVEREAGKHPPSRAYFLALIDALVCDPHADFDGTDFEIARIHVELGGMLDAHGHPAEPEPEPPPEPKPDPAAAARAARMIAQIVQGPVPRDFAERVSGRVHANRPTRAEVNMIGVTEYPCE